jgi:Family of unknown function (DUF6502)
VADPDTQSPAQAALAELLAPLCELALRDGVKLQALVELTKRALVNAADTLYGQDGAALSDSRVSVMTGVHRKDLRSLRETAQPISVRRKNLAAEVFGRWLADPQYLTSKGKPRVLPRQSAKDAEPSFDSLVAGVSQDVHPRAVLEELVRLELAHWDEHDKVRVLANAFTPSADRDAQRRFLAANAADHMRAGRENIDRRGRAFLEQAIYSDQLSAESAQEFNGATLATWEQAFASLMPQLRELYQRDRREQRAMTQRVRFGMYGYVGAVDPSIGDAASKPKGSKR